MCLALSDYEYLRAFVGNLDGHMSGIAVQMVWSQSSFILLKIIQDSKGLCLSRSHMLIFTMLEIKVKNSTY